jgi:hypothetical protein
LGQREYFRGSLRVWVEHDPLFASTNGKESLYNTNPTSTRDDEEDYFLRNNPNRSDKVLVHVTSNNPEKFDYVCKLVHELGANVQEEFRRGCDKLKI